MQALIDFEGWRRWRGFDNPPDADGNANVNANALAHAQVPEQSTSTLSPSPPQTDERVSPMHSSVVTPLEPVDAVPGGSVGTETGIGVGAGGNLERS